MFLKDIFPLDKYFPSQAVTPRLGDMGNSFDLVMQVPTSLQKHGERLQDANASLQVYTSGWLQGEDGSAPVMCAAI
jgi:hypothetical protein